MRKILALSAAIASVFAVTAAHADILLIDDFNFPVVAAVVVADQSAGNGITWQTAPATTALPAPNLASTRRIGVESILDNSGGIGGIAGNVGGPLGRLNFTVDTADNGNGYVEWVIPSFAITTPASYFFSVIASSLGSIGFSSVPNLIDFHFNGLSDGNAANDFDTAQASIGAFGFNPAGNPVNFNLSDAEALKLSGGGTLTMKVSGGQGWNLRLDQFAINLPEPTSLALVGLALLGAGVVSRRRKA